MIYLDYFLKAFAITAGVASVAGLFLIAQDLWGTYIDPLLHRLRKP